VHRASNLLCFESVVDQVLNCEFAMFQTTFFASGIEFGFLHFSLHQVSTLQFVECFFASGIEVVHVCTSGASGIELLFLFVLVVVAMVSPLAVAIADACPLAFAVSVAVSGSVRGKGPTITTIVTMWPCLFRILYNNDYVSRLVVV
jgi:hypothetical protein